MPKLVLFFLLTTSLLFAETFSLHYTNRGSRSVELAVVKIAPNGSVDISLKQYASEPTAHSFLLSPLMKRYVRDVLHSSLSSRPLNPEPELLPQDLHSGTTKLSAEIASRSYELHSLDGLQFDALRQLIWRIINQATVHRGLIDSGDVYKVQTALSPRAAEAKLLQPDLLLQPLIQFIDESEDYSKIRTGLEALQYLLSPEEFAGFIGERLHLDGRERFWFHALPAGNLEKAHREALMPLYLSLLVRLKDRTSIADAGQNISASFMNEIGHNRYTPAIPYILSLDSYYSLPYLDATLANLSRMGYPALKHISAIMDSKNINKQLNGCELMLLSARLNPRAGYSNPVSGSEYNHISKYISEHLLPKAIRLQTTLPEEHQERLAKIISNTKVELSK